MDENRNMTYYNEVKQVLGDYDAFFSDLLSRTKKIGVDIRGLALVQLLYRTSTLPEYERIRDDLRKLSSEFVETQFNGRAVSIAILKEPLLLADGFMVSAVELPAPRSAHMYPSGLESVGVLVGSGLPEFNEKYKAVLTGIKDHGLTKPSFITFDNGKTIKFYEMTLKDLVQLEGYEFEFVA